MSNLELEFKRWMNDFEKHETLKPVKHAPLQCLPNEFVFYYNPNSRIEGNSGRFYITNKGVVFDVAGHGITAVPLSDVDITYKGLDEIEISQGDVTVHVSGNSNIMYTLIGLLKRIDGAKYVRQGYDTVNHVKEESELVRQAVLGGAVPEETGGLIQSLLAAYGTWYQYLLDCRQGNKMDNNTSFKVYGQERILYSQEQAAFIKEDGGEKETELMLTDYRFCFKNESIEKEVAIEDILQARSNNIILTISVDTPRGAESYMFGNVLAPLVCNALYFMDRGNVPNWISPLLERTENDPPEYIRSNKRPSRLDDLKNSIDQQYFDAVLKTAHELVVFIKKLDEDENVAQMLACNSELDLADKIEIEGLIYSHCRLFYVVIEDLLQTYIRLGYTIDNFSTKEGVGIIIVLCKMISYDLELNDLQDSKSRGQISAWMKNTVDAIHEILNKLDGPPLFQQTFSALSRDICSRHAVLTYRLASIIAKADGEITMEESNCLASLMKLSEGKILYAPGAGVCGSSSGNGSGTSSFEALNDLIGLTSVKNEVVKLSNFIRIQKSRESSGLKVANVSCHCVFTGNPGTGKTSVARILAQIFGELGVLKKGHLVETDRSGLVGEYVGQTAIKTNKVIDEALDGVLFIDEAYSLVEGGKEDYGKEAINTLLKRMEDDRDRLVVVLAGYTNEMERFINANPGLRSRFNRYIEFPDYTEDELCDIYLLCAKANQYEMTPKAMGKLHSVVSLALSEKDVHFGNGRYVRNLFEKTIERQATRLSAMVPLTHELLLCIEADDIPNSD